MAEIALFEPGTPFWLRLTMDTATGRVLREHSVTKAHFATQRYYALNAPQRIRPPASPHGG